MTSGNNPRNSKELGSSYGHQSGIQGAMKHREGPREVLGSDRELPRKLGNRSKSLGNRSKSLGSS